MNLQDIFYVVGIISMVLYTILLIIVVIALTYIAVRVKKLYAQLEGKVGSIKAVLDHPEEVASEIGAAVAGTAIRQVGKTIKSRGKKASSPRRNRRK